QLPMTGRDSIANAAFETLKIIGICRLAVADAARCSIRKRCVAPPAADFVIVSVNGERHCREVRRQEFLDLVFLAIVERHALASLSSQQPPVLSQVQRIMETPVRDAGIYRLRWSQLTASGPRRQRLFKSKIALEN